MCNILTLPPPNPPPPGLLKSRFILFLPIVDKHSKFYQTGILRLNQILTILLSYFKIINKKKINSKESTKIWSVIIFP